MVWSIPYLPVSMPLPVCVLCKYSYVERYVLENVYFQLLVKTMFVFGSDVLGEVAVIVSTRLTVPVDLDSLLLLLRPLPLIILVFTPNLPACAVMNLSAVRKSVCRRQLQ